MVVIQYPHTLTAIIKNGSVKDDEGNWIPGDDEIRQIQCRAEINGAGEVVTTSDGRQVVYSWVVYMPKGTKPLPDQTAVEITSSPIAKGNVLSFSEGQLNSRLWL